MNTKYLDVLIVGAGISGIGAGCHLQKKCPDKSFAIIEARANPGGTWDLFRYPGIRSDSDMYTLGYVFKPWTQAEAIADGPAILDYLHDTIEEHALAEHIHYGTRVVRADWSSEKCQWLVETRSGDGESQLYSCNFLHMCSGYYNYAQGHTPEFLGRDDFTGDVIHPQHWPQDLDYADKRVVVIGSGATAVTLVPAMAERAATVTMLQRSPTYVVSRPARDALANGLRRVLPVKWAYFLTRWRNILMQRLVYNRCQTKPEAARERIIGMVKAELGPDYDVDTHFSPRYQPWDQRLCLVPDSDLFKAIKSGQATVVTDTIERFTATGILLSSGAELPADLIVTATGLELQFLSDIEFTVDSTPVEPNKSLSYKGMMMSDVPNLALSMGYTNASWTLKCDLTCDYVCRLLNYMDKHGFDSACPRHEGPANNTEPFLDLTSGYVTRAQERFPQQGEDEPWKQYQNYLKDIVMLRHSTLDDGAMEFSRAS